MPHKQVPIDLNSPEARSALAKMFVQMIALWRVSPADQLALLGLSPERAFMLKEFENGGSLPSNGGILDRVSRLLAIHKALGLLYPNNEDLRYSWVSRPNRALDGRTPLNVMVEGGVAGIDKVRRLLTSICAG